MFVECSFLSATAGPGWRPQLQKKTPAAQTVVGKLLLHSVDIFLNSFLSFSISHLLIALLAGVLATGKTHWSPQILPEPARCQSLHDTIHKVLTSFSMSNMADKFWFKLPIFCVTYCYYQRSFYFLSGQKRKSSHTGRQKACLKRIKFWWSLHDPRHSIVHCVKRQT